MPVRLNYFQIIVGEVQSFNSRIDTIRVTRRSRLCYLNQRHRATASKSWRSLYPKTTRILQPRSILFVEGEEIHLQ